jgi:hypothetical protein
MRAHYSFPYFRVNARIGIQKANSMRAVQLSYAPTVCLLSFLSAAGPTATDNVRTAIARDGARPEDASLESVTWHRTARTAGVSTTVALLGGHYTLYASGERADDPITIDVFDKGTGSFYGRFVLSGVPPHTRSTLTLPTASICLVTVKPPPPVALGRAASYDVAIGLVGPLSGR